MVTKEDLANEKLNTVNRIIGILTPLFAAVLGALMTVLGAYIISLF